MSRRWLFIPTALLAACAVIQVAADKPASPPLQPTPAATQSRPMAVPQCTAPAVLPPAVGTPAGCCMELARMEAQNEMPSIQVAVSVLHVSARCFMECGGKSLVFMDEKARADFLEAAQRDPQTQVVCAPKLAVLAGQTACVQMSGKIFQLVQKPTAATAESPGNCEKADSNISLTMVATPSADRRYVTLDLQFKCTGLCRSATENCQQLGLGSRCTMPSGQSCMLNAGAFSCIEPCVAPLLATVPYLNRLFSRGTTSTTKHLLLVVTPVLMPCGEQEGHGCPKCPQAKGEFASEPGVPTGIKPAGGTAVRPCAPEAAALPPAAAQAQPAKPNLSPVELRSAKAAAKLVEKYYAALEHHEPEKARKYARQALDLDPCCFAMQTTLRSRADPNVRHLPLTQQSEDFGPNHKAEWKRIWFGEPQAPLTPERVHGGIQ